MDGGAVLRLDAGLGRLARDMLAEQVLVGSHLPRFERLRRVGRATRILSQAANKWGPVDPEMMAH